MKIREIWLEGKPKTVRTVADDYVMVLEDETILADTTAKSVTITMLSGANTKGREFQFSKISGDAHTATIHAASGETLPDGTDNVVLSLQGDAVVIKGVQ